MKDFFNEVISVEVIMEIGNLGRKRFAVCFGFFDIVGGFGY